MGPLCLSFLICPPELACTMQAHIPLWMCKALVVSAPAASSNPLLFGARLDFLEFISRQDTGARAACAHSLPFSGCCTPASQAGVSL